MQHSPRCIMVHQSANIQSFDDLRNLTLAMNDGRTFAKFLRSRVQLEGVRVVNYVGSVAKFLIDTNYAQQGYVFSEPLIARRQGGDPQVLMVSDLGFDPYTSVVAIRRDLLTENSDLVEKFVAASRRGWLRYLASPAATNAEIHRINPDMDLDSLAAAVIAIQPLCLPDGMPPAKFGEMNAERWQTLAQQMIDMKVIRGDPVELADKAWQDVVKQVKDKVES